MALPPNDTWNEYNEETCSATADGKTLPGAERLLGARLGWS